MLVSRPTGGRLLGNAPSHRPPNPAGCPPDRGIEIGFGAFDDDLRRPVLSNHQPAPLVGTATSPVDVGKVCLHRPNPLTAKRQVVPQALPEAAVQRRRRGKLGRLDLYKHVCAPVAASELSMRALAASKKSKLRWANIGKTEPRPMRNAAMAAGQSLQAPEPAGHLDSTQLTGTASISAGRFRLAVLSAGFRAAVCRPAPTAAALAERQIEEH
jgi:hypothetical protein